MSTKLLKLAAEDEEDLKAISALVQDAVLTVGDVAFLPKARRFALVLNRYRWEGGAQGGRGERVRAGLRIDGVVSAQSVRISQQSKDIVLSLLALSFDRDSQTAAEEGGADAPAPAGGTLTLAFAGGAAIRLKVEGLDVHLDDLGGPWAARGRPSHEKA